MNNPDKRPRVTPGLRQVLERYCQYRNWRTVPAEVIDQVRALIERVGTVEEVLTGLEWFFESKKADDYVIKARPNLPLTFLIKCWERYEIQTAELESRAHSARPAPAFNEYAIMRQN